MPLQDLKKVKSIKRGQMTQTLVLNNATSLEELKYSQIEKGEEVMGLLKELIAYYPVLDKAPAFLQLHLLVVTAVTLPSSCV